MNPIDKYFLPNDVSRCSGVQTGEGWRNGCDRCLRRIAGPASEMTLYMEPPALDSLGECRYLIDLVYR